MVWCAFICMYVRTYVFTNVIALILYVLNVCKQIFLPLIMCIHTMRNVLCTYSTSYLGLIEC